MRALLSRFLTDDRGATALEYGLIVALIFLVAVSAITAFGGAGSGSFNATMAKLSATISGT